MPANDAYSSASAGPSGPAKNIFAVAPNDGADLPFVTTGLYVGGAGDVSVLDITSKKAVLFKAVPAGSILPIRVARVRATGTTATNIVGLA